MSASLVGSEMCIRDRDPRPHVPKSIRGEGEEGPAGSALTGFFADAGPVSYTHLTLPTICSV
eukprot:2258489-Alexandrium_andersonii.AAC.1